ncbi:MAG: CPBP family intramembrane metalloprotease [Lachnospiraceae bacterium]|nr:CPBP family intramembrane metalloprotease [Lachnospiraceae bacterium]
MNNTNTPGKIISKILTPFLVYYIITFLAETIFMTALMAQHPEILRMSNYDEMLNAAAELAINYRYEMLLIASAAVFPVMNRMLREEKLKELAAGTYVRYEKPDPLSYINVAVLGVAGGVFLNCLIHISGIYTLLDGEEITAATAQIWDGKIFFELLGVGILSAAVEEITFRGLILHRFESFVDTRWALLGSSFIFSLAHGSSLQGIYAFAIGMLAGLMYLRFRTVLAPFILHMSANIVSVLQNETHFLDNFAASDTGMGLICMASAAAFMVYFYLIISGVDVKPIDADAQKNQSNYVNRTMP